MIGLVILATLILSTTPTQYLTNFNANKTNSTHIGDPLSLPLILNRPGDHNLGPPLAQTYTPKPHNLKDHPYINEY